MRKDKTKNLKSKYLPIAIGTRFGYWTVIGEPVREEWMRGVSLKVRCDCGSERYLMPRLLVTRSSNCCAKCAVTWANKEGKRTPYKKHGMYTSSTYISWQSMRRRCAYPDSNGYESYGGRGIQVCSRWEESFESFLADMGERPEGMTLDRIDVDGDYCADNCRWSSAKDQARNKSNTRRYMYKGEDLRLDELADRSPVTQRVISDRIYNGWAVCDAVERPLDEVMSELSKRRLEKAA